jgi:hypothetical protein
MQPLPKHWSKLCLSIRHNLLWHSTQTNYPWHIQLPHPGSEKWNWSIRTCAQDVQFTRTVDNMINRRNISIKQSNIPYIMTCGSEKDYIKAAAILSVVWAFTGVDWWRGPPSAPFLNPVETPGSNLQFHLDQRCRQVWVDLWLLLSKWGKIWHVS